MKVMHLFATPLVISTLPPEIATEINPKLRDMIVARSKKMPGSKASNNGGWQSDDKIIDWGGPEIITVLTALHQMLDQITMRADQAGIHPGGIEWKVNGWANINRKGDFNAQHIHPAAYWSAVYYVTLDDIDNPSSGGNFQVMDPRGGLTTMYCPVLRVGLEGYVNHGATVTHRPHPGQCLIFPSWLPHAVSPYNGEGMRISLAFNFSV
jgi:uncharacterized protein (TIGR02466 family)